MPKVTYEDGTIINFEGKPSPEDIEEAYGQYKSSQSTNSTSVIPEISNAPDLTNLGLASGALLAGGLASKGIAAYRQPWNERNIALKDVMKLQGQLGLEQGGSMSKIVPAIKQQTADIKTKYGTNIRQVKENTGIARGVLTKRLDDFNKVILDPANDNLAMTIKEGYPQFKRDTYASWKTGMDSAERLMEQSGKELSWKSFGDSVFKDLDPQIESDLLEQYGKGTKLTISKARTIKNAIFSNESIPLNTRHKALENYADFIEKNAPVEVQTELAGLNKNYKVFKELERGLGVDTGTGVFDDEKLYKYLKRYSERQQDVSTQNALKVLGEGTDLSAPIKDVKSQAGKLEILKQQRGKLENAISKASASEKLKLRNIKSKLDTELGKVMKWQEASNRIDKLKIAQKRVNTRSVGSRLSRLPLAGILKPESNIAKIAGKTIPIMGVVPQLLQAGSMASEFDKWRQQGGFLATDPLGGTEQINPEDIEKMLKYGLVG